MLRLSFFVLVPRVNELPRLVTLFTIVQFVKQKHIDYSNVCLFYFGVLFTFYREFFTFERTFFVNTSGNGVLTVILTCHCRYMNAVFY